MRLLADLNVAPGTVTLLQSLGYDVVRVDTLLPASTPDAQIVEFARARGLAIVTQDLDFSALVALSGARSPSIISVRLGSARVEVVNRRLEVVLPRVRPDVLAGAIVTVGEDSVRVRALPVS